MKTPSELEITQSYKHLGLQKLSNYTEFDLFA